MQQADSKNQWFLAETQEKNGVGNERDGRGAVAMIQHVACHWAGS